MDSYVCVCVCACLHAQQALHTAQFSCSQSCHSVFTPITVFWNVEPFSLVDNYRHFEGNRLEAACSFEVVELPTRLHGIISSFRAVNAVSPIRPTRPGNTALLCRCCWKPTNFPVPLLLSRCFPSTSGIFHSPIQSPPPSRLP